MEQVTSLLGLAVFVGIAWLLSSARWKVPWRLVAVGLSMQFVFAWVILRTPPGRWLEQLIGVFFTNLQEYVRAGTVFVFGDPALASPGAPFGALLNTFAFNVLPTVVFFSAFMSMLYYLGVMQVVVKALASVMRRFLGVSGAESLSAAANVFVGHTEAPLVVRPYIETMTLSELNAMMVGGFATISGGLLAAYAGMGINPGHLVTAAVISAPAGLLIAKIIQPETGTPITAKSVQVEIPKPGVNVLEAITIGASDGMKLAINIAAMLLAFLALIAMADSLLGALGAAFGFVDAANEPLWSLSGLMGYVFAPIAWVMGVEAADCRAAGQLLGLKMVANEFIAYQQLGTWLAEDSEVKLSGRSAMILTYALSGFSNFGAIGIQIGGIGSLAPARRPDLARLGLRAMIGGALACCMTGCIAGLIG